MPKLTRKNICGRLRGSGPDYRIWPVILCIAIASGPDGLPGKGREDAGADPKVKLREKLRPPEVTRATLDNGLRVVIVRRPAGPGGHHRGQLSGGFERDAAGFPGTAHAQEHMMFRGSPGLSADQLAEIAAAMGGKFNADTQQAVTQYFFTVPAEDLDVALHVEADSHARRARQRQALGPGARRHRAGGGPGSVQSALCLLHQAPGGDVQGYAVCPRRAGDRGLLRPDHRRHAEGVSTTPGTRPTMPSW